MPKPAQLRVLKRSDDAVNCCAWHPSQKTLAVGADDGRVTLYDATKGKELSRSIQRKAAVSTVAFAHDGSLAVGGADGLVAVYDKRGTLVRELAAGEGVRSCAFAPKTREVCVGGEGGVHLTYFHEDGKRKLPFPGRSLWVWSLAFSPDGCSLAVGGDDDSSIAIIQTKTNEITREIKREGPDDIINARSNGPFAKERDFRIDCHPAVRCLAYAPDGFSLAAGGLDSRVVVYYLPSATVRTTIKRQGPVWAVAYSVDGNCLAIGGADQRIAFHDVGTGAPQRVVPALDEVRCLAFSPTYLASGDAAGMLVLHPVETEYTGPKDDAQLSRWEAAAASDDDDETASDDDDDDGVALPPITSPPPKTGLAIIADKW
jgi:WD40 repeat protein